jgi:Ca2+-binding EF-hand superfamily protein
MDVDGSGDLTFEEFRKGFINFGLKFNLRETKALFRLFDVNGDGTLSYAEFVAKLKGEIT